MMKIQFSISYSMNLEISEGIVDGHAVSARARGSDWGKRGLSKYWFHVADSINVMKQARDADALVLCSAGIEAFIIGKLRGFYCPRTTIVCADILLPRESKLSRFVGPWLKRLDAFACIRRGDIATLGRRFGVPAEKCQFVYFPVTPGLEKLPSSEGDYIYAAGWSHRDWPTLIKALAALPYRAVLSPGVALEIPDGARDRIEVLPMQNPQDGRKRMAASCIVAVPLAETELPSGPLVLLDAMAMAKAAVATSVNGTRDYIKNGETALIVPAGDSAAMAEAIRTLMEDAELRRRIGREARADALARFSLDGFVRTIVKMCVAAAERKGAPRAFEKTARAGLDVPAEANAGKSSSLQGRA